MTVHDISFQGLATPVRCVDCNDLVKGLAGFVPGWPFSAKRIVPAEYGPEVPCAVLAFNGTAWLIQSPHTTEPRIHKTQVNVVCDLLSILASALIAQSPGRLCFHAAAVERNDGLILFPALRRAGKSTLSVALMARGARMFTDDYLLVDHGPSGALTGQATGIAARLRLPLPDGLPPDVLTFVGAHPGPENKQYRYVGGATVAPHGTMAPIRSIVLLDRADDGPATLSEVPSGDVLAALAKQNFSRGLPAGEALSALITLTQTAPAVRLTYSDVGEAADLVMSGLDHLLPAPRRDVLFPRPGPHPDRSALDLMHAYQRTRFAVLYPAGDVWVGASCDGERMLQFDAIAANVLDLLDEAISPSDLLDLLADALPDMEPSALRDVVTDLLRRFLRVGYIARAT